MNNKPLDASKFKYHGIFCNKEFEDILTGIIACYYSIVSEKIQLPPNNENYIRDIMLRDYLRNTQFKNKHPPLYNYHFDKEITEEEGRVDIRILLVKPYIDEYAYYIIECKRLDNKNKDGISGLNGKYVYEGIMRFVSKTYPFYKQTAGMIGFFIVKTNIDHTIEKINGILKKVKGIKIQKELEKVKIIPEFAYSYCSSHNIGNNKKFIYHLMFDFSDNIEFISYCQKEYKDINNMTEKEVSVLFKKYNIFDYINTYYFDLHTMDRLTIVENITSFIRNKKTEINV
jgi:hypothetical protein